MFPFVSIQSMFLSGIFVDFGNSSQGSGLRAPNPAPSAPVVNSCTDSQNPHGQIAMPMPFGAGIGLTNVAQNVPQNLPPQNFPQPQGYSQATSPPYPQNAQVPTQMNYSQPNLPSQNFPQNYQQQVPFGQGYPPQVHPNIYPNLNHSAPFSYTHSAPVNRSTSGYMRQVTWLRLEIDENF
jgi:hypothetical protein